MDLLERTDVRIHFPAGAESKDGPSAGVTIVTVLVSFRYIYLLQSVGKAVLVSVNPKYFSFLLAQSEGSDVTLSSTGCVMWLSSVAFATQRDT